MRSTADPRVEVFAVEPSAAQLVVRARYDGDHALSVGTRTALVRVRDGVGAAVVERLEADTAYQESVRRMYLDLSRGDPAWGCVEVLRNGEVRSIESVAADVRSSL